MSRIFKDDKKKGGDTRTYSQKDIGVEYANIGQIHHFSRDECASLHFY